MTPRKSYSREHPYQLWGYPRIKNEIFVVFVVLPPTSRWGLIRWGPEARKNRPCLIQRMILSVLLDPVWAQVPIQSLAYILKSRATQRKMTSNEGSSFSSQVETSHKSIDRYCSWYDCNHTDKHCSTQHFVVQVQRLAYTTLFLTSCLFSFGWALLKRPDLLIFPFSEMLFLSACVWKKKKIEPERARAGQWLYRCKQDYTTQDCCSCTRQTAQ